MKEGGKEGRRKGGRVGAEGGWKDATQNFNDSIN